MSKARLKISIKNVLKEIRPINILMILVALYQEWGVV